MQAGLNTIPKNQKETLTSLGSILEELKSLFTKSATGYRDTILLGPTNNSSLGFPLRTTTDIQIQNCAATQA